MSSLPYKTIFLLSTSATVEALSKFIKDMKKIGIKVTRFEINNNFHKLVKSDSVIPNIYIKTAPN